ncbi:mandelate racemase/muconate lactonizing enzyme family protein [Streptomyces hainanensis]|uniref:mandelate racemase/muconate lactonizing enzyme family protein n=1 Tax=Streptomyces hainanensis TaxID=402648 RepID=UPI0014055577|nr:enolase C-terminal domain-like protein [Streptomyces hainanensis]
MAFAEIAVCSLELPAPVRLGDSIYPTRDYVVLRLVDGEGTEGFAFGYSRGTPLAATLESILGSVVGTRAGARAGTVQRILSASPAVRPLLVRAVSLADIALWDLTAKSVGAPLVELLGATRDRVPVMPVAGYFRDVRGDDAVIEEIAELERRGHRQIKLMVGAVGSPQAIAFLGRAREALASETRLAVDAHYSLSTVPEAVRTARALEDAGVTLLEDPFVPTEWRKLRELRRGSRIELAAGEDVVDPVQYLDLLESVSVLRVDPTTCGGVRAALSGIEAASHRGVEVIPHVFTAIAAQLAGAFPIVTSVEHISVASGSDPIDRYFDGELAIEAGEVVVDRRPGVGIHLDWERLRREAVSVVRIDAA